MTREDRKLQTRMQRRKVNLEIKKSSNSVWLDKWMNKLDKELDDSILYSKRIKIKSPPIKK